MPKGFESKAECSFVDLKWGRFAWICSFTMFSRLGTPKRRYIGPQMWYMCTSAHALTLGHILNQSYGLVWLAFGLDVFLVSPDFNRWRFLIKFEQTCCDKENHIAYQSGHSMFPYLWFNVILHPLVEQLEKFARRKGGLRTPTVWSIDELDWRSIRFLLSGLGRVSQEELYFDEPDFGV